MKGIIYIRVSSEEQVKGTSLENQDELCRAYCKNKGIEVVEIFREEGASAKTADRAEFLRAIEYCRKNKGRVDAFIVYKVDRFARNTEDHFYVRKTLLNYGVSLHSVTEPIGNNPAEKFIETILAGSAEFDNAMRTQRCVNGMMMRMKQGITPYQPPLGYVCQHAKRRGEKKNEPDQPDEVIFPIIQQALKEFSKGIHTQVEMVNLLDKLGLARARGKKTHSQLISKMFINYLKFYAGIIVNPWTQEEYKGLHKPMITEEEYYKIRNILSGKSNRVKRIRLNPDFPLRQTVKCGICGKLLTGSCSYGVGGKYYYYHCFNKECSMYGKAIAKNKIEEAFIEYLNSITPKKEFLDLFSINVLDLWKEKGLNFEIEVQKYARQLNVLEEKRKRIFEMREDGSYSMEEFKERREEIEDRIMTTKISLDETRIDQFDIESTLNYAKGFILDLGRQWLDLASSHTKFQKLVFPDGIPYTRNKGFGTARLGLIYELNQTFVKQKSPMVDLRLIHWNSVLAYLKHWQDLQEALSLAA